MTKNIATKNNATHLTTTDWLQAALEMLADAGIGAVKIVPLAKRLGVTSGSFYWHFHNRPELYDAILDYWEREMTDKVMEVAPGVTQTLWTFEDQVPVRTWGLRQAHSQPPSKE